MDSPGVAPESPACGAGVFLLDDEPDRIQAEAGHGDAAVPGLELTSGTAPPAFSRQTPHLAGSLPYIGFLLLPPCARHPPVCRAQLLAPGVGIERATSWFRARRNDLQLSRSIFGELGEMDSNHRYLVQSQAAYR